MEISIPRHLLGNLVFTYIAKFSRDFYELKHTVKTNGNQRKWEMEFILKELQEMRAEFGTLKESFEKAKLKLKQKLDKKDKKIAKLRKDMEKLKQKFKSKKDELMQTRVDHVTARLLVYQVRIRLFFSMFSGKSLLILDSLIFSSSLFGS